MSRETYKAQVALLISLLPLINKHSDVFALKGGTAINLFYRDLPRLSVDIDLTYLPIQDRQKSLAHISATFLKIVEEINRTIGLTAVTIQGGGGGETRIQVSDGKARVKIETSPVTRGVV